MFSSLSPGSNHDSNKAVAFASLHQHATKSPKLPGKWLANILSSSKMSPAAMKLLEETNMPQSNPDVSEGSQKGDLSSLKFVADINVSSQKENQIEISASHGIAEMDGVEGMAAKASFAITLSKLAKASALFQGSSVDETKPPSNIEVKSDSSSTALDDLDDESHAYFSSHKDAAYKNSRHKLGPFQLTIIREKSPKNGLFGSRQNPCQDPEWSRAKLCVSGLESTAENVSTKCGPIYLLTAEEGKVGSSYMRLTLDEVLDYVELSKDCRLFSLHLPSKNEGGYLVTDKREQAIRFIQEDAAAPTTKIFSSVLASKLRRFKPFSIFRSLARSSKQASKKMVVGPSRYVFQRLNGFLVLKEWLSSWKAGNKEVISNRNKLEAASVDCEAADVN